MTVRMRFAISVLALAVLAAVFAMYIQPDFMVQMANQVWACF
ncbi:MAG: hypothetical protein V4858_29990 [Pseudomonadota bacterium]